MRLSIPLSKFGAKWALMVLAIVAMTSMAKGAPANLTDDFSGPTLDPAWVQVAPAAGHIGLTNGTYCLTALQGGGNNPKLQRFDTAGAGGLETYSHEVTFVFDTFFLAGSGGVQADIKWKSFGPDGFMELVLNSFGNCRLFHNNSVAAVGGNLVENVPFVGLADGDTLKIVKSYDSVTDTINVAYSINGGALNSFYTGAGSGGSIGNVIGNFIEFELFKWGAVADVPIVCIDEWKLSTAVIIEAIDDSYEATTDLVLAPTNGVLDNDIYTGTLSLSAVEVDAPTDGGLILNADGTFSYTPDPGFAGEDTFTYKCFTSAETSEVATVTITVTDPEGIVANDDGYGIPVDQVLIATNSVLDNDDYTGALTLSAVEVDAPTNGSLGAGLNADGTFTYTPDPGFIGEDTFTYKAYSSIRTSEVATVTIYVWDPEGITANDDSYDAYDGVELAVSAPGVMENDNYTGIHILSSYEVSGPANGTLTLNTDGSFTYTADPAFIGEDSFTYEVHSLIRTSNVATVTLTVSDVEASLVVNPDSYAGALDEVLNIAAGEGVLSNDEYAGASLSAIEVATTTNGVLSLSADGSFTYTPGAAFIGFDSFTYEAVTSGGTTSAVVQVTLETADPSIVSILFQPLVAGNGISTINAVATQGEVALPITIDFNNGSAAGDQWGGSGLAIGGSAVTFTTTQMTSFSGTVYTASAGSPTFSAPNEGLGVDSEDGGKIWMIDGSESFTWQADKDLVFEGIGLRAGFNGNQGERTFSVSSGDWIGLAGVVPQPGISFDGFTGTFTINNGAGNVVGSDNDLTAEEMVGVGGPALAITAASDITFASLNGPSVSIDNFAIEYAAFSADFSAPAVVLSIAADGTDVIVSWDGVSGGSYTLQSKSALTDVSWGGDVTGFEGAGPHSVTNVATGAEFYQVIAE